MNKVSSYSRKIDQRFGNENCLRSKSFKSQLTSKKPRISTISRTLIRKLTMITSLWELQATMETLKTSRVFCAKKTSLMKLQFNRTDRGICLTRSLWHNHVCLKDSFFNMSKEKRSYKKERTETGMILNSLKAKKIAPSNQNLAFQSHQEEVKVEHYVLIRLITVNNSRSKRTLKKEGKLLFRNR